MSRIKFKPEEFFDEICDWIADGKTLRDYCRQQGKPGYRTVYFWIKDNEELYSRFTQARDIGADVIAEEALSIIDTEPEFNQSEKSSSRDSAHTTWLRNRAEFRLKLLAKWFPQKYGDKVGVDHSGGINITVNTGIPDESDDQS